MAVPERVKEVLLELLLFVLVVVLLVMAAALALALLSALLSHVGQRSEPAGTMQSELARMVGVAVSRYKVLSHHQASQSTGVPVCTENLIRVDDAMESPKLAE